MAAMDTGTSINGSSIHTGYWVDWSNNNAVLGSRITYDTRYGSQLVSGATILVQFAGGAVWSLAAFWLHQHAVANKLYDEFEAQKQVILRNTGSAPNAIVALSSLAWTWRGHAKHVVRRALAQLFLPILIFVSFAVAGVFVSHVTESPFGGHVLLTPGLCGFVNQLNQSTAAQVRFLQMLTNTSIIANAYARDCYSSSSAVGVSCNSFAKSRMSYQRSSNVACPLGAGSCALNDSAAVAFTALVDSHQDLGINAKFEDRIQYGYEATCAPLSTSLLSSLTILNATSGLRDNNRTYPTLYLNLGSDPSQGDALPYNYSTALRYYGSGTAQYTLTPFKSYYPHFFLNPLNRFFTAGAPFNTLDADVSLFVIAQNNMAYSAPSADPVFSTYNTSAANNYFVSDHDVAVIACTERYQICKDHSNCTSWSPILTQYTEKVPGLDLNPAQNATWTKLVGGSYFANMYFATHVPAPLRAADYVTLGSISAGLSNRQWIREVESWFQSSLAHLQYLARTFPQQPDTLVAAHNLTVTPPDTDVGLAQCSQQMIQIPAGYASYNVFALILIFVLAGIMISIAFCVSMFGHNLPNRHPGQKSYQKLLSYQGDGMLQLHRMAVEAAGYGGWKSGSGHKKDVPFVDQASKRLPPPSIFNNGQLNAQTDADSIEDGLLNYHQRQSLKQQLALKYQEERSKDSFDWIQLNPVPEGQAKD